ncbi:MAG: ImmA/IrrE family metallo-endopeptidase [Lachnospiraceae bacterium]|nr:ImmA/IrrE family metallo-endopeptidase [Lachnospiraceae bacterium]
MDYITHPTSREELRMFSRVFRYLFGINDDISAFPVLRALEMLPDVFPGSSYEIVEDDVLPANVPARCILDSQGNFTIEIKESIYKGAFEKNIGAYLGFICHELCHGFLFKIGYTPIVERSFGNSEIRPFESVEWQAKALCGEVMMPYEATKNMSLEEIVEKYHVSKGSAYYRIHKY